MLKLRFFPNGKVVEVAHRAIIPVVRGHGGVHVLGALVSIDAAIPRQWWRDMARRLASHLAGDLGGVAVDVNGRVGVVVHPLMAEVVHDILLAAARQFGPHPGVPLTGDYRDLYHTFGCVVQHDWWKVPRLVIEMPARRPSGVWSIGPWWRTAWGFTPPAQRADGKFETLLGFAWRWKAYEEARVVAPWPLEAVEGGISMPPVNLPSLVNIIEERGEEVEA